MLFLHGQSLWLVKDLTPIGSQVAVPGTFVVCDMHPRIYLWDILGTPLSLLWELAAQ